MMKLSWGIAFAATLMASSIHGQPTVVPLASNARTASDSIRFEPFLGRASVVFGRAVIQSDRDQIKRMHFGYSDGVVIYCNGTPIFFGMNPPFFRDLGGMDMEGDAGYLPLKKGANEVVFAVTEYSGGWAFWARLDR
jgi:hypothetical protein